ncbi:DUF1206 domain-containing protein [Streptomyces flavofungini]|uniref:DUF1206 domain-containing protein n=1 Tax=Streptomyces flavofungini TaxID=68200 RepID=A0ABS0X753_9ACTN|nr:DUF1206 domain-containing protein [Streptomyces flavofungini]MBJ3809038.1 DUF1206 domain-containing protein [Streptomyces flavofungini]
MGFDGVVRDGTRQARRVAKGRAVGVAARAGFVARGALYALVGVLALRVAFAADGGQQADRGGALTEIADKPFGNALLWLLALALAGMALWRLSEALFGQAGPDGRRAGKRLASAGRAVFYGVVGYSVLAYVTGDKGSGSGSSDRQSDDVTATALGWPSGQWIVGAVGAGVAAAGVWIAVRAVRRTYHKHLRLNEMSTPVRRTVDTLGVVGGTGRGAVFAAAGAFVVVAAARHEPGEAKGMDDVLRSFRDTPAGPWLLVAVALALVAFGLFSWACARWRRV